MIKKSIQNQIALVAFVFLVPSLAIAQVGLDTEGQKQFAVNRLYQLTYGAHEMCKPLKDESIKVDEAIDKYRATFPELFAMMDKSPYLPGIRERFKNRIEEPEIASIGDDQLKAECTYIESLLSALTNEQDGKKTSIEWIRTLKK